MNKSVAYVLKGFTELNAAQREEFINEINKYIKGEITETVVRKSINDSVQGSTRMTLGPAPTSCPCCGR